MRLVVTRPEEDAGPLAERLRAMGHEVLIEPMLVIADTPDATIPPGPWQAILVTSANAARALARQPHLARLRATPVLAVGAASAEAARAAGFASVTSAEGDLTALVALVRQMIAPGDGRLLYPTGRQVSGNLAGQLGDEGYAVVRVVLYEAVPAREPSAALADALASGTTDGVLLFSPRTARVWRAVTAGARLGGVTHYCLSPAVAEALATEDAGTPEVAVADRPDTDSLLRLLDR